LAAQVKLKIVDKGKAKVIDTGKPEKVKYPIMTGGDFKIREPKVPTPPPLPIAPPVKKDSLREKAKKPSKVARVLKLLDEKESPEAGGAVKDQPQPTPQIQVAVEESVEVIEAPLAKKRKLTKVAGTKVPVVGTTTPIVEAVDVVGFLASRRKKVVLPSVPPLAEVEKFIANEPVLAVPVAVAQMVEEGPLRVPKGSIPILSQPLGSNIRHILKEIDVMSEDSIGGKDSSKDIVPDTQNRKFVESSNPKRASKSDFYRSRKRDRFEEVPSFRGVRGFRLREYGRDTVGGGKLDRRGEIDQAWRRF
jgi:hypothetical protein